MSEYSVALTEATRQELAAHLLRDDGQEDLCFALWHRSTGANRTSALITSVVLPEPGDRQVHRNASVNDQYFLRALDLARKAGAGLTFLHSHPLGITWQELSPDDYSTEHSMAAAVAAATGRPLLGATMNGSSGLSARIWSKISAREFAPVPASSVRSIGAQLMVDFNEKLLPKPAFRQELSRTISAWGDGGQATISRLRIGIVGAGSVGTMVAESLARMGISDVRPIDFDVVEIHNLDRQLHATIEDAERHRAKARVLAEGISRGATSSSFRATPIIESVAEEAGFRAALDCDVLFSCVDRPLARFVLNTIAYAHLIPVIDGGIRAVPHRDGNGLKRADWTVATVGTGRQCLECSGQYDASLVAMDREGALDDATYIAGLPETSPLKANQNVFVFSMNTASLEVLQLVSLTVARGLANPMPQTYHVIPGYMEPCFHESPVAACKPHCLFPSLVGLGDDGINPTGRHVAAELARAQLTSRTAPQHEISGKSESNRIKGWIASLLKRKR